MATLVVMPLLIPFLHKIKFGQSIRKEGPQSHMAKTGTPTMGGLVFVSVPILVMLVLDYKAFFLRGNADLCTGLSGLCPHRIH